MSRSVKIVFPSHIPSKKNSRRIIRKGRYSISLPSALHDEWYHKAQGLVEGIASFAAPVRITLAYTAGNLREWDVDGSTTSVLDLLVNANVIPDDNWKVVRELNSQLVGYRQNQAQCEVLIEQLPRSLFYEALDVLKDKTKLNEMAKILGITQKAATALYIGKLEKDIE
jgi:hypothetical protein